MKKKFIVAIFLSFVLVGCTAKTTSDNGINSSVKSSSNAAATASPQASVAPTDGVATTNTEKRVTTQQTFETIKPGTLPPLTSSQKSQINDKINSALNSIDSSLNSLEDAIDIDLSSVD